MLGSSSARVKVKDQPLYLDGRTSGLVQTGDGGWKKVKVNVHVRLIRISVSEAAKARGNDNIVITNVMLLLSLGGGVAALSSSGKMDDYYLAHCGMPLTICGC